MTIRLPTPKVYRWSAAAGQFALIQNIPTFTPYSLNVFTSPSVNASDQVKTTRQDWRGMRR